MPTFDIVSKVNSAELINAVDQANREVKSRFDFKDTNSSFELKENKITLVTQTDFQLKQMIDILRNKISKRNIDIRVLDFQKPELSLHEARQTINVLQGINADNSKIVVKLIKDSKLKVQTSILGENIRVSGKKRDDLQAVIAMLRSAKLSIPLQFENFRD